MTQSYSTDYSHLIESDPTEQENLTDTDNLTGNNFPFVVEHLQEGQNTSGTFRPAARLLLTPALRTSGLWTALPPEEMRDLLLMLTFLTPNGRVQPTLPELAQAMQVSPAKARARLLHLTRRPWQGQPLVNELTRPSGLDAYLPARSLLQARQGPQEANLMQKAALASPPPLPELRAGREALIARSRAHYAAPRAEVEADIARRMGWGPPAFEGDDPAVAEGKRRAFTAMTTLGMPKEQALDLLARFDLGEVESQIAWLPSRNAKNPARFLAAAIEGGYDRPLNLRGQADVSETHAPPENKAEAVANKAEAVMGESPEGISGGDLPVDNANAL